MKKFIKWIGIAVLIPILLCLLLTVLIYLPPVQNWAVKKVAAIASEKTGMEISVGHVSLAFPLDLQLDDFKAIKQNDSLPQVRDTIADVHRLVADVRLLPLFRSRVVIDELSFHQARINTNGFISDLRIKGDLQELWLSSKGIDLDKETVEVNGARLQTYIVSWPMSDCCLCSAAELLSMNSRSIRPVSTPMVSSATCVSKVNCRSCGFLQKVSISTKRPLR